MSVRDVARAMLWLIAVDKCAMSVSRPTKSLIPLTLNPSQFHLQSFCLVVKEKTIVLLLYFRRTILKEYKLFRRGSDKCLVYL